MNGRFYFYGTIGAFAAALWYFRKNRLILWLLIAAGYVAMAIASAFLTEKHFDWLWPLGMLGIKTEKDDGVSVQEQADRIKAYYAANP